MQVLVEGRTDIQARIDQGKRIVNEHNSNHPPEDQIRFVVTLKRAVAALG